MFNAKIGLNQNSLETQSLEQQAETSVEAASVAAATASAAATQGNSDSVAATGATATSAADAADGSDSERFLSRFLEDVARSSSVDEQATMLKFRLDEAIKTVQVERK